MKATELVNIKSKTTLFVSQSKIKGAGDGLFAKKYISKGNPVVVYYGDKFTNEDIYELYTNDPEGYHELNKYVRGTPNGYAVKGDKSQENTYLLGVYVNDIGSITCKKDEINETILKAYANTARKCNLKTVDTSDYPVYVATKRIKKGEELYVHYGTGHWLSFIGYSPEEISDLNNKYRFAM